jgi:hypothetical protein
LYSDISQAKSSSRHPLLKGRIFHFTRGFGSLSIGGDTKSFSPFMALGHLFERDRPRCHPLFLISICHLQFAISIFYFLFYFFPIIVFLLFFLLPFS